VVDEQKHEVVSVAVASNHPTEDEELFGSVLLAMGDNFKVRSKARFCQLLQSWVNLKVSEVVGG
jgi:hypothetical protein